MYHNYYKDLKKSALENCDEYRLGFEQGVIDFAERLKKYCGNPGGTTFAVLTAYHIEEVKKELLEDNNND